MESSLSRRLIPVGTQVVTLADVPGTGGRPGRPRGSVAVVVTEPVDPGHSYRVRFPDGEEAMVRGASLIPRKAFTGVAGGAQASGDLDRFIIYRCIVGSRAYGLETEASDTDRRGIYLPPAELQWSIYGVPEQIERPESQECYWELGKFVRMALKANPNVLECLYTPLVEEVSEVAAELRASRSIFLSRLVYQTYNGYVLSQFKKIGSDLRTRGEPRWKHAMHLIRLLQSGITALREGHVPVNVGAERERLLDLRAGRMSWDDVEAWRLALHREMDAAFSTTSLPERPDYEKANHLLVAARRRMVAP